jgi:signal transduction histidine kinase/CheY-like chemotaxis protein/HPt (histidine-containing phosphotransfer) domain-containing protein
MILTGLLQQLLVESDFADTAMAGGLNQFCLFGEWDLGHLFTVQERPRREIASMNHWFSRVDESALEQLKAESEKMRVVWGGDVPGRVIASASPEWFRDAESLPSSRRMEVARRLGVRSGFAFPVLVADEVVAVFEVFSLKPRALDPEQVEVAHIMAAHFARLLERDRLSGELTKARQEAMDAVVAKSSFLAQVSHEIRTPLNAVLGMTHLLSNTTLNHEQKDFTESIRMSAHSLLRIVNDLLDISRIEAGKFEIQPADFEVKSILKETCDMLAHVARGKRVALSTHLDPSIPDVLRGDAGRLRQVLLNLVGNAIKFTDQGHVAVRVLGQSSNELSIKLRFEVEDTGIGIPESQRERVFELFTQADHSAARKYGGTGLGLAISKRLVELMGGEIGFHSTEGVGSVFWFNLNLNLDSATPMTRPQAKQFSSALSSGKTALVVEDNEINLKVMIRMLDSMGLQAVAANSGVEALRMMRERSFDLVFMDCQMPGMDGYETTREIRRLEAEAPSRKAVPIVAVTASAVKGDRERCLASGMDDYLSKPLDATKLLTRINYWLRSAEDPVDLDLGALARIRKMNVQGQGDFLAELVGFFRDSSPKRIAGMRAAIEKADAASLSRDAHYLKSSSANLGAMELSSLCQRLDELGRSGVFDGASETLDAVEFAYQGACAALHQQLLIQN